MLITEATATSTPCGIALQTTNTVTIIAAASENTPRLVVKTDLTTFAIPLPNTRGSGTNNTVAADAVTIPADARGAFHLPPACHPIGGSGTSPGRCHFSVLLLDGNAEVAV